MTSVRFGDPGLRRLFDNTSGALAAREIDDDALLAVLATVADKRGIQPEEALATLRGAGGREAQFATANQLIHGDRALSATERDDLQKLLQDPTVTITPSAREFLSALLEGRGLSAVAEPMDIDEPVDTDVDMFDASKDLHSTRTTHQLALKSLDGFLLNQQQMLRGDNSRLNGVLDSGSEILFRDSTGRAVELTDEFIKESGLGKAFELFGDHDLHLNQKIMKNGVVSAKDRHTISEALLHAVEEGYELELHNPRGGEHQANLSLKADAEGLVQNISHTQPASSVRYHFDRREEVVPGIQPPMSFAQAIATMEDEDTDAATFQALNEALHQAYVSEKSDGSVHESMDFAAFKLQFLDFNIENVTENGLRWHDGDDAINAAEWAFLHQKVSDLPEQAQHYYWTTLKWDGQEQELRVASSVKPATVASIQSQLENDGWYIGPDFKITVDAFSYSLPGKQDVLPMVQAIPAKTLQTLLAGPDGNVLHPQSGKSVNMNSAAAVDKLRLAAVSSIANTVMNAAFHTWSENVGDAMGDLLKDPLPDTQRVFLRQSNGTENADRVGKASIGQKSVVTDGNDTGAFGKCAPTSYFCATITGIATGARSGLNLLLSDSATAADARHLESLLTSVPLTEASRSEISSLLRSLTRTARGGGNSLSETQVKKAVASISQIETSILDRMVVKHDAQGPYFDMKFTMPNVAGDPYMADMGVRTGKMNVKVRPEDIQEYLEQTNRADAYRNGKKHMMDFFKDPAAMNGIDLMRTLGVGIIAVGVDKALKTAGKADGLLFGPGPGTVASLVYGAKAKAEYMEFNVPIAGAKGKPGYDRAMEDSRDRMLGLLGEARDTGGACALTMGYTMDNFHVNYLQSWGTPTVSGVEIASEDLARCHMNYFENPESSSAWNNDRVQDFDINTQKMTQGLEAIQAQLYDSGEDTLADELTPLIAKANEATDLLSKLARKARKSDISDLWDDDDAWSRVMAKNPRYRALVRESAADTVLWLKNHVVLDNQDGLNEENVTIMPSNTERDNMMSDNRGDKARVGGGQIGDQEYGSANACDGSYFVPLNALAGGWNGKDGDATGYRFYEDTDDYFVMLSSMEVMMPKRKRSR